ncbi:hypothetical protein ACROYT_G005829 [Oculina patagonica]
MQTSKLILSIAVILTVAQYHCEASQNGGRTNEKLNLSGFEDKEDKKEQEKGNGGFRATEEEPEDSVQDESNKNTPQGSKQGSTTGAKRALPALAASVLKNPKIQEAVVDKGLEVMNKLVDKQLRIIDEAQEKASNFLAKEIKLDIMPDKGWSTPDMFVPPGYHMGASISGTPKTEKEEGEVPYTYAPGSGLGYVMMNGCWGKNYTASDPCYNAKWTSSVCQNMIDGAAFLGVGFDGRGEYSPESRKMSIVQRNCKNKATYDDYDVPDTMNVHGIYDTSATMHTFESRGEFQKFLQQEAGVSGSYFGFYAGAKKAWGSSQSAASQQYMSILDVDVDRYEVFMDEVKPEDLSLSFLREFMNLPNSYFEEEAPLKYQNFIQRWGTHFIKSAKFGGELEIRKTMDAAQAGSKTQFSETMEFEYKSLFASVGAKYKKEGGESVKQETKTTSTAVEAKGGSQDIASILSDVYAPTFKTEFKEWLKSIPQYPKAFKFQMSSITDLVNFRANDLFPDDKVTWGCEGKAAELETEKDGRKFYYTYPVKGQKKKIYCKYDSRQSLEEAILEKRTSLKRAIEIYMEEGPVSLSDVRLEKCPPDTTTPTTKPTTQPGRRRDEWMDQKVAPKWEQLISSDSTFKVSFDMLDDLINPLHSAFNINKDMKRSVRYRKGEWYTSDSDNAFHMYSGFSGVINDRRNRRMNIFGLTLSYNERDGSLFLDDEGFKSSKKVFPALAADMKGKTLARVESVSKNEVRLATQASASSVPCHAEWSNILRIDLVDMEGKCLHFTAASKGTVYVVFSASPKNLNARYVVEISSQKVVIFKGTAATSTSPSTTAVDAVALGENVLYESYFVCITISGTATLIEYGKSLGTKDGGIVYLNMIDRSRDFDIRFYAFGNKDEPANIMDAHIVSHKRTEVTCKGETVKDAIENLCAKDCHKHCNPVAGCKAPNSDEQCYVCRVVKKAGTDQCLEECPSTSMINKKRECVESYDAKVEGGMLLTKEISVGDELSTCMWLKLGDGTWTFQEQDDYDDYAFPVWLKMEGMNMLTSLRGQRGSLFLMYMHGGIYKERNVDLFRDKAWHQVCTLWSTKTAAWSIYLDGKRDSYGIYNDFIGRRLGTLELARSGSRNKMLMTQFNLWDRVLTNQEIEEFAKSCNHGVGSFLSWADLYDAAKASRYIKPSSCQASPQSVSTTVTPAPTTATTTQAVTTKAPGQGKRGVKRYNWYGRTFGYQ